MTTATSTTQDPIFPEGFVGPCGDCACEKRADCPYCETCIEQDPRAAADAEPLADERWGREHAGSFAEWLTAR